jgi:iron complex outermembrane receptor protein
VGVDADFHQVKSINSPFDSTSYGYNRSRNEGTAFVSLNKNFSQSLSVSLLGRQVFIDGHPAPFIPSVGLEYASASFPGFFIKTNFAKNYHHPSLNDLYYIPGGNPNLKPEEGLMADLGMGYTKTSGNLTFMTSVNGYASKISNWIIWLPSSQGYWVPFNMKTVEASGIEFKADLKGKISSFRYQVNTNYAYTRSINKDDPMNWADESYGKQLPFIPVHSANISATLTKNGFHLTWTWNYYSKRYTTSSTDKDSELDVIYPYIMNNLYIGKNFSFRKRSFDIELKILNLFDEEYRTVLQNMMPGRNYSLLLRYDF